MQPEYCKNCKYCLDMTSFGKGVRCKHKATQKHFPYAYKNHLPIHIKYIPEDCKFKYSIKPS